MSDQHQPKINGSNISTLGPVWQRFLVVPDSALRLGCAEWYAAENLFGDIM